MFKSVLDAFILLKWTKLEANSVEGQRQPISIPQLTLPNLTYITMFDWHL